MFRSKFIASDAYNIKKGERFKCNDISTNLKKLGKYEQFKSKGNTWKKIMKIKLEIEEIEKGQIKKSVKPKAVWENKVDKPLDQNERKQKGV